MGLKVCRKPKAHILKDILLVLNPIRGGERVRITTGPRGGLTFQEYQLTRSLEWIRINEAL